MHATASSENKYERTETNQGKLSTVLLRQSSESLLLEVSLFRIDKYSTLWGAQSITMTLLS